LVSVRVITTGADLYEGVEKVPWNLDWWQT
jgi:hypothetical protein